MSHYAKLTAEQMGELSQIEPSLVEGVSYYPVSVKLKTGETLDAVYLVEANGYWRQWGVWPEEDRLKSAIDVETVLRIMPSPKRLSPNFANQLRSRSETGMGYFFFTVCYRNSKQKNVLAGSAVDFVDPPRGMGSCSRARREEEEALRGSDDASAILQRTDCLIRAQRRRDELPPDRVNTRSSM